MAEKNRLLTDQSVTDYHGKNNILILEVESDGNCFYRAFAESTSILSDIDHKQVRQKVADFMTVNKDNPYILRLNNDVWKDENLSISNRIKNVSTNGIWATTFEIYMTALAFEHDIVIIEHRKKAVRSNFFESIRDRLYVATKGEIPAKFVVFDHTTFVVHRGFRNVKGKGGGTHFDAGFPDDRYIKPDLDLDKAVRQRSNNKKKDVVSKKKNPKKTDITKTTEINQILFTYEESLLRWLLKPFSREWGYRAGDGGTHILYEQQTHDIHGGTIFQQITDYCMRSFEQNSISPYDADKVDKTCKDLRAFQNYDNDNYRDAVNAYLELVKPYFQTHKKKIDKAHIELQKIEEYYNKCSDTHMKLIISMSWFLFLADVTSWEYFEPMLRSIYEHEHFKRGRTPVDEYRPPFTTPSGIENNSPALSPTHLKTESASSSSTQFYDGSENKPASSTPQPFGTASKSASPITPVLSSDMFSESDSLSEEIRGLFNHPHPLTPPSQRNKSSPQISNLTPIPMASHESLQASQSSHTSDTDSNSDLFSEGSGGTQTAANHKKLRRQHIDDSRKRGLTMARKAYKLDKHKTRKAKQTLKNTEIGLNFYNRLTPNQRKRYDIVGFDTNEPDGYADHWVTRPGGRRRGPRGPRAAPPPTPASAKKHSKKHAKKFATLATVNSRVNEDNIIQGKRR